MKKKRGIGAGKVNGPGGKIDPGEHATACAVRETREEMVIDVPERSLVKRGELFFQFRDGLGIHCTVFSSDQFSGDPTETDEADPFWCSVDDVPYDKMWADDSHWMPQMLAGENFCGHFIFDDDDIVDADMAYGSEGEARWVDGDGVGAPRFANALSYGGETTSFRPCIDLHSGQVKQIVGGSLTGDDDDLKTNFVSERGAAWFAGKYKSDALRGGHVIKLGPGNDDAARAALLAYPGGLQVGGGINAGNAREWVAAGASHVIVTSYLFDEDGRFCQDRLDSLVAEVGRERLVIDLSCRRQPDGGWVVAMNRWQTLTDTQVDEITLHRLAESCDEFLIHAADVEGMCGGIDQELVEKLGEWSPIPVTYAGGARSADDLELVNRLSHGRVDLTIGSALDLFGGSLIRYEDCVAFNRKGEV